MPPGKVLGRNAMLSKHGVWIELNDGTVGGHVIATLSDVIDLSIAPYVSSRHFSLT